MKINKNQGILIVSVLIVAILLIISTLSKKANVEDVNNSQLDGLIDENNPTDGIDTTNISDGDEKTDLKSFDKSTYDKVMLLGSQAYNQQKYQEAIDYYKQALKMEELAVIYGKMFSVYKSMGDYKNAFIVLDKARNLNPEFNQYWIWTIEMKRDVDNASYADLEKVYNEGINKVELTAKVNFVTFFARVSQQMNENQKSINLWNEAIKLDSSDKLIYQAEIDSLSK